MTEYRLYVESGPKQRTTQVHVLALLGCVVQGPTTAETLEATPEEIRRFLRFLKKHGEAANPEAPFTTTVAAHEMGGSWIGQGDPVAGFEPDFAPLPPDELALHVRRLGWLREDLMELLHDLTPQKLTESPAKGRATWPIVQHAANAHYAYLQATVDKVEGLLDALKQVEGGGPEAAADSLPRFWRISSARLAAMTEDERTRVVQRGQKQWTARRGMRRTLEHEWEHFREIERRVKGG